MQTENSKCLLHEHPLYHIWSSCYSLMLHQICKIIYIIRSNFFFFFFSDRKMNVIAIQISPQGPQKSKKNKEVFEKELEV